MKKFTIFMLTIFIFCGCDNNQHNKKKSPTPEPSPKDKSNSVYSIRGEYIPYEKKVKLKWELREEKKCDSIDICRNDDIIDTVDGDSKEYIDENPPTGQNFYAVKGSSDEGGLPPPRIAIVVWEPERVSNFMCDVDYTSGDILLSWENGQTYDSIILFCNDEELITLAGDANSYRFKNNECGAFNFEIFSTFGVHETMSTFCSTTIDNLSPIDNFICELNNENGNITLQWNNGASYDNIIVNLNGSLLANISGESNTYIYENNSYGVFNFEIQAESGFRITPMIPCEVTIQRIRQMEELTCEVDYQTGNIILTWNSLQQYDSIDIIFQDNIFETINGSATSYEFINDQTGTFAFGVQGNFGFQITTTVYCETTVTDPLGINALTCSPDYTNGNIILNWENGGLYDDIIITCNDEQIETLNGDSTTYTYINDNCGIFTFEVQGISTFGNTESALCEAIIQELTPINNLTCEVDSTTGDIVLNWTSQEPYDEIMIECGDEIIETIEGSATSYTYGNSICGVFDFRVWGTTGFRENHSSICRASVGRLVWDEVSNDAVVGFHVYIWEDEMPENDPSNADYSVGLVSELPLLELFEENVLPETNEQINFRVALTSYDSEGNYSEFSNTVECPWATRIINQE